MHAKHLSRGLRLDSLKFSRSEKRLERLEVETGNGLRFSRADINCIIQRSREEPHRVHSIAERKKK